MVCIPVFERFAKAMEVFKGMEPPSLLKAVAKVIPDSLVQFDISGERFYLVATGGVLRDVASGNVARKDYTFIMDVPTFEGLVGIIETYKKGRESEIAMGCARYFIENYDKGKVGVDAGLAKRTVFKVAMGVAKKFL